MSRETMALAGAWRFQVDVYNQGRNCGWWAGDFDRRRWLEATVPGTFEQALADLANYEGRGWYARTFEAPPTWKGRRVTVRFEGVCARAKVWLNGKELGEIRDSYLPAEFVAGEALNAGGPNVLAVEVDNARVFGEAPGVFYGWRPFGGILRDVSLAATDALRIEHVATRAEADGAIGQVVEVVNDGPEGQAVRVELTLRDAAGRSVCELAEEAQVAAGGSVAVSLEGRVAGVAAWSPESPALYGAQVRLTAGGRLVDERVLRVGFRTIGTEGDKLMLNGRAIFLKGFNRHEDSPRTNQCPDAEVTRADLRMMKEAGCNFVRLCHYPHDTAELDLCDEMGLLAMGEIPLYWWGQGYEGQEAKVDPGTLATARGQLAAMIRRDGNHASVAFWSVSNETNDGHLEVAEGNRQLVRWARECDPSRLAVHVSNTWIAHPNFEADDVVCVNDYPTWWQLAGGTRHEPDYAVATRAWQENLARLRDKYPGKPILVSEFGGMSLAGVRGGALGEDVHAKIVAAEYEGIRTSGCACGATVWCWADHPWPHNRWMCNLHVSPFGALARDRRPKEAYRAAREAFTAPDPCHPGQGG